MQLEDALFKVAGSEPHTTIQAAVNAAAISTRGAAVLIPSWYKDPDTYTNTSNVTILDLRPLATSTGFNVAGAIKAISSRVVSAVAASPVTAATGGVFATTAGAQVTLQLPTTYFEQVPFVVKASGYITAPIGTYTVTVQPLLYASTTGNFTATAANAILSAAAASCTVTSAVAITVPFEVEAHLIGDSTSGKVSGWNEGVVPVTGATLGTTILTPTTIANAPSSVSFVAAPPLAFAFGVTIGGGAPSGPTINMGSFFIQS